MTTNYSEKIKVYPEGLLSLLHFIKLRPAMYLGSKSFDAFQGFICGFIMGNHNYNADGFSLHEFDEWLLKKFKCKYGNSFTVIKEKYKRDRFKAWFNNLDEFNATANKKQYDLWQSRIKI